MSTTEPATRQPPIRRLPLSGVLRVNRPSDIWFKPATSVAVAATLVLVPLLVIGRSELAMYVMSGAFCALYGHHLPYAARLRAGVWVVIGMTAGMAVALVCASLVHSVIALIAIASLIAGLQKAVCDATRIGPPGHVILVFVVSGTLFAPQELHEVPFHTALTLGAGILGGLIALAPALIRREGPERRATARALEAAAGYLVSPDGAGRRRARHAAAAAVHGAWQSLLAAGKPTRVRHALEHLVLHAEASLIGPSGASDPDRLRAWARQVRGRGPLPEVPMPAGTGDELLGVGAEREGRRKQGREPLLRGLLRAGSPLLPIAVRCAVGCAAAGYVGLALGVGHPYWAIVSASAIYQANVTLTWHRVLQRLVGNVCGVAVFAAVVPLARTSVVVLAILCIVFSFCNEMLISRNYWLGSVSVTPMALLITEFAHVRPAGELITDRVLDTLAGVAVGMVVAILITNRRTGGRMEQALGAAERATDTAEQVLASATSSAAELATARRRLTASLVVLRDAADTAAGEWWQRALPEERLMRTEQRAHRTLAATVRRQGLARDRHLIEEQRT
ncbi:FUSC family protein [Streptomyces luomodiensis]|uniref:FUSC family protein n=1 Tax=Streptomyces luomodiensis TaxID=3026192 RepID=A0ABY9UP07_9ACTN|nr:FUSC family protein [Streptomyces sp. SCA4-21]WNE94265.1 FUSC family protein [Streptomyces sp. SCA4-21]